MLEPIRNTNQYKKRFFDTLETTLERNNNFKLFLQRVLCHGTAYVVGGFLRDIANKKASRDLDLIIDLQHQKIEKLLLDSKLEYRVNRMQGVKVVLDGFEVDLWSVENNWAFKKSVVKKNNARILHSIANGCFYNFDSLVINIKTRKFVASEYNKCVERKELDIIQKRDIYKQKNPTIEANILKAFYLQKEFGLNFSENCLDYLVRRIEYLETQYQDPVPRLMQYVSKYKKYQPFLKQQDIISLIKKIKTDYNPLRAPQLFHS